MTGNNIVTTKFHGAAQETLKFQMAVTVNAGIGGKSALIAMDEFINYLFPEICLEIKYVEGHTQPSGNTSGIFHIFQGTAGIVVSIRIRSVVIKPHDCADAVKSCLLCQKSGNRAVYTAAHGNQSLLLRHIIPP